MLDPLVKECIDCRGKFIGIQKKCLFCMDRDQSYAERAIQDKLRGDDDGRGEAA